MTECPVWPLETGAVDPSPGLTGKASIRDPEDNVGANGFHAPTVPPSRTPRAGYPQPSRVRPSPMHGKNPIPRTQVTDKPNKRIPRGATQQRRRADRSEGQAVRAARRADSSSMASGA